MHPQKAGVDAGPSKKLDVPVSYLLRCQKLGLTICHIGIQIRVVNKGPKSQWSTSTSSLQTTEMVRIAYAMNDVKLKEHTCNVNTSLHDIVSYNHDNISDVQVLALLRTRVFF